jgi:hypothetical protein
MVLIGHLHTPAALSRYELKSMLGGLHNLSGSGGKEESRLPEIEPKFSGHWARSLVTIATELPQLQQREIVYYCSVTIMFV